MKRILYLIALMLTVSIGAKSQTLIERSDGTFTQGDQYLAALKALSIPYGVAPTFDGGLARDGSIFFNTTTKKLVIWTGEAWDDVGKDTDLSGYYTKSEVDALLTAYATIDAMNAALATKVDKTTTINGNALTGNIELTPEDIGAASAEHTHSIADVTGLQDELDDKSDVGHTHVIGNVTGLQSALDDKQETITGAATTIVSDNLTNNRALISNGSGKVAASTVTANELSYLSGVSSSLQSQLEDKIPLSQKGANNGVAPINASGKIPSQYLDVTTMTYMGTWNANTNTPALSDATGNSGEYYRVTTGGTQDLGSGNITFVAGDDVIHNGTTWQRVPSTQLVTSVNGQTGNIVLGKSDVGLSNVDNTADLEKPISNATQTALDTKENATNKATTLASPDNVKYPTTKAVSDAIAAIPPSVPQTLSLGTPAGNIAISGGNSVNLSSLNFGTALSSSFVDWAAARPQGVTPIYSGAGTTGLPDAISTGLYFKRVNGINSAGSFGLVAPYSTVNEKLYYLIGNSTSLGTYITRAIASEEWASSNFVNTTNNQSGINGNKAWNGTHTFTNNTNSFGVSIVKNTISTSNGRYLLEIDNNAQNTNMTVAGAMVVKSSGISAFTINASGNVGVRKESPATALDVNGVITATGGNSTNWNTSFTDRVNTTGNQTGISGNKTWTGTQTYDGSSIFRSSGTNYLIFRNESNEDRGYVGYASSSNLLRIHAYSGSAALTNSNGSVTLNEDGTTSISSLNGTGDRMVVANSAGLLRREAIPDLSLYLPLTGGTITGNITATTDPTAGGHLTNKTYVDDAISTAIADAGGKAESVTVAATSSYTLSWDTAKKNKFGDFGNFEVWLETGGTYKLATVPVSMTLSGGAASAYTFTLSNVNAIIVIK